MELTRKRLTIAEIYVLTFIREQQAVQARNHFHHLYMEQVRKGAAG